MLRDVGWYQLKQHLRTVKVSTLQWWNSEIFYIIVTA